jgi:hypothetical protein
MESIWLKKLLQAVTLITGAALVVSLVLLVLDLLHPQPSPADQARVDTAKLLMAALENTAAPRALTRCSSTIPFQT